MAGPQRLGLSAFERSPIGQLVVDAHGAVAGANGRARSILKLERGDVGRRLQDLELSHGLVELRSKIDEAYETRRPVEIREVDWTCGAGEAAACFDVHVVPLFEGGAAAGVQITFSDVTRFRGLQNDLRSSHEELAAAYEKVRSTREELETTHEELQSTIEELETTNEELETMNEELQLTNDELQTINTDLRDRSEDVHRMNDLFGSVLASLREGVAVLGLDLEVHVWNRAAEELWGLRSDEVRGKALLGLDIGLPVERLEAPLRACLSGARSAGPIELEAVDRRGRVVACRVACRPLYHVDGGISGAIVLMDADPPARATGSIFKRP